MTNYATLTTFGNGFYLGRQKNLFLFDSSKQIHHKLIFEDLKVEKQRRKELTSKNLPKRENAVGLRMAGAKPVEPTTFPPATKVLLRQGNSRE